MATVMISSSGSARESHVSVNLNDEDVVELFEEAFDGYCPACRDYLISDGDVVCCDCLGKAIDQHWGDGCCDSDKFTGV